jgi:hypothetical protein
MEVLLREEDSFNGEDITIKPVKGYNTPPKRGDSQRNPGKDPRIPG